MCTLSRKVKGEVWNPEAWDYKSKQIRNAEGTISYEKQGTWVLSDRQASKIMNKRLGFKAYKEE